MHNLKKKKKEYSGVLGPGLEACSRCGHTKLCDGKTPKILPVRT